MLSRHSTLRVTSESEGSTAPGRLAASSPPSSAAASAPPVSVAAEAPLKSVLAAPGALPQALDAASLARLSELDPTGANRLIERVLQAFETSVARLRPQLDAARLSGDRASIRLVSHTFKSSAASIGALHLSQLCARIETAIRLEDNEHLDADLDAMNIALDDTLIAIADTLKDRK